MRVRVAPSAIADLDEIWLYVAKNTSIENAERVVNSITERLGFLARNPEAGRERSDLRAGVRSLVTGKYRIYYRVERGAVRVLHVRHGARDEGKLFR